MVELLKVNSVKCLSCNTELFSRHRHDFTTCNCENKTFTDGGLDYQRVGGNDLDLVEITSEYEEITKEELEERTKALKERTKALKERTKALKERTKALKEKSDKEFQNNLLNLLLEVEGLK